MPTNKLGFVPAVDVMNPAEKLGYEKYETLPMAKNSIIAAPLVCTDLQVNELRRGVVPARKGTDIIKTSSVRRGLSLAPPNKPETTTDWAIPARPKKVWREIHLRDCACSCQSLTKMRTYRKTCCSTTLLPRLVALKNHLPKR